MPNFQPDLVYEENRSTGWARVEIYGDRGRGTELIPHARTVLGNMKCYYGVNERQVDNRNQTGGGGYFHSWKTLEDGSMIHAITNDGHDTVRIYASRPKGKGEVKPKREDDFDTGAYLWIGARVRSDHKYYYINTYLIEPGTQSAGIQGCITQAYSVSGWVWDASISAYFNNSVWSFSVDPVSTTSRDYQPDLNATAMLDNFQKQWTTDFVDSNGNAQVASQPVDKTLGQHNLGFGISGPNGEYSQINFSANGVLCMSSQLCSADWFTPYDPHLSLADNDVSPVPPNDGGGGYAVNAWDVVYVIDPFDYKRHGDTDTRESVLALTQWMRDNAYIPTGKAQILPGTYKFGLQFFDTTPVPSSSRAGDAIPSFPGHQRSQSCDYSEYMHEPNISPLEVEVEIRIGKAVVLQREPLPDPVELQVPLPGTTFKFLLTCPTYDSRHSVVTPIGYTDPNKPYDSCIGDGGPNMGGPSFSQWIDIDIGARTAVQGGSTPVTFIGLADYHDPVPQKRYPTFIYAYGSVYPQADQVAWDAGINAAVRNALEAMSSGVYGCDDLSDINPDLIGLDPTVVWRIDASSGAVTAAGGPGATLSSEPSPPRDPNFDWYYEYAIAEKNQCHNTMGVLLISTGDVYYEGRQDYVGWPGQVDVNCCT